MSATLTRSRRNPIPSPDANLGYLFRLAHQRFRSALEAEVRDLDLSAQEYGVLSVFGASREVSISELARIAQVTRQTMHAVVVRLEEARLVERRAANQRVIAVRLTERGSRRLEEATARVRRVERAALTGLSTSNERIVRRWLSAVAAMAADAPRQDRADGTP